MPKGAKTPAAPRGEARSYLASIVESSDDAIIGKKTDGTITSWNPAAKRIYGYSAGEAIGENISILAPPDRKDEMPQILRRIRKGERIAHYETIRIRKDGRKIDVSLTVSPIKDRQGRIIGASTIARDITERKKAEEQIHIASLYARSLIEASLDPLVTISPDGKITDVNNATEHVTGVKRTRLIGSDFSNYFTEPEKARAGYKEVLSKGFVRDYPLALRHKSGNVTDVLYNATVYRSEEGKVIGVFAAARDITEKKQAEERLQESEKKFRNLVESVPIGIAVTTPKGEIIEVNTTVMKIFGYTKEEFEKLPATALYYDPKAREGFVEELLKKGKVADFEAEFKRKDGSVFWGSITTTAQKTASGKTQFLNALLDITERKRAAEKLSAASLYARSLIEASLDPLVTISPDGKITDVNNATEQVTGIQRAKLIGSDFSDYFTEPEKARKGYKEVLSKGFVRDYPLAIKHKSGRVTDVLYNATIYTDEKGRIQGVFAAARDITERKMVEEQLRAASLYERSLIEASLDPLVTIGPDGKITDVNKSTELATGVPRGGLIGTDFSRYFTEPDEARKGYRQVFARGFVKDYPLSIRHKSGKVTDVLYNATVYRSEAGKVIGVFAAARDITERKRVEQQLHAASLYARSLIEASLDPLVTISPDGKITDVNNATEHVTGVKRTRLIGSDFSNYFTEPGEARKGYKQVFEKGFVKDYPLSIRHRSGRVTDVLYNATVYRSEEGKVIGVFAAARDITERKRAEEQLHAASLYSRSLIEASLDPLVTISPDGKITDVNNATEQVTGIQRAKLIGSDFSDYFTEPEKARKGYKEVLSKGFVRDYPLAIKHKSGRVTDVLYNATVYRSEAGNVTGVFAAARDITKRKLAEEQLRAASLYARSLIEASLDPLVTISPGGKITDVNKSTELATGVPRDRLIGSDFFGYFTEPEKARAGYRQVFSRGFVRDYPLAIRHASGRVTDVLYNATVYRNELGEVEGVFAAARDITEKKQAEERLRESEEKYRAIFENTGTATIIIDEDTTISTANAEFEKLSGYAKGEVEGKRSWGEFAVKADVDRMMEYHRLRRIDPSLAPRNYEFRFITREGETRNAFLTIDLIPGTKKSVASISDITKLKQAEGQLTEEKKKVEALLALKDEFIIDIGHELKTPLSIILGNLALLRGVAPPEREAEWLNIIEMLERNSMRLGGSIDKILELYKIGTVEIRRERVQIHEVLEDVYREQAPLAKLKGLKFDIEAEPVAITGDGSLLKLALSNLVNNAIKFTNRGCVSVRLKPVDGSVSISVADTGIGISPENRKRLFEKFFKADPSAPGTGIGLAITKEIMDKHGGEIKVTSAPGKGSTFELLLPRCK